MMSEGFMMTWGVVYKVIMCDWVGAGLMVLVEGGLMQGRGRMPTMQRPDAAF